MPIDLEKSGISHPLLLITQCLTFIVCALNRVQPHWLEPPVVNPVFWCIPHWYIMVVEFQRKCYEVSSQQIQKWCQASLSITNSCSSLKLPSIESVMPSSHLILCRPLLLLPPIPPSIRVFSNEPTLHMRWPKYWSFSFSIIPCKEIPGLISFRMDWLDLLAVQGTLKSLLQRHSSKASILRGSAFFTVQLSFD